MTRARHCFLVFEIMLTLGERMRDESETQTHEKTFCLTRFSGFFLTRNVFKFQQHSCVSIMTTAYRSQGSKKRFRPYRTPNRPSVFSPTFEVLNKRDSSWAQFCSSDHPGTRVHGKLAMRAPSSHPSRTIGRSRDSVPKQKILPKEK